MKVLDCHIHVTDKDIDQEGLLTRMKQAGVDGGALFSVPPDNFIFFKSKNYSAKERLTNVLEWCKGADNLFPVYWINPTEDDAVAQAYEAVDKGVLGFKIICNNHYPGDPRATETYKKIAEFNRPIFFHSGILWDGKASSKYNRPAEFEDLLGISGLRFSLAHVSWPWTDECIAVYGKFQSAYGMHGEKAARIYIDLTPGTPLVYRTDVFHKLFHVGYHVTDNIIFGTDACAPDFDTEIVRSRVERDKSLLKENGLSNSDMEKIFSGTLETFLNIT